MHREDLRPLPLFDGLTDEQLEQMLARGDEVALDPGEDVFREGDHADRWWVLIDGEIELIRHVGREDTVVGRMDVPGRWAGGFRAWDEHGVYLATGRAVTPGRVFALPSVALRELANAWFPFGGHLIRGLNQTARSIESTARQRGAPVTLGTLAAGLAHEINNPAAAAARAVEGLDDQCQTLLSSLGELANHEITSSQFATLDELRLELVPAGVDIDPLDRSDREQELSNWLTRHDIAHEATMATALAAAGANPSWCDRVVAALPESALRPGLEWVASTVLATTLLSEVKESTRRISELVAAVRSYSQMDRASMQHIDVTEGLESTLVMLGHKLRDGITVVRNYGVDVPHIDAYPGELNQVWTNLIDNAVDATDGTGTLTITVRPDEDHVQVEIRDSGSGMTAEVRERAFEAFYTTKEVGKGTGLGLDIARRIVVERHGGEIAIDSSPAGAAIRVRLPITGVR